MLVLLYVTAEISNSGLICCHLGQALRTVAVSVKLESHWEILGWGWARWGCGRHKVPGSPGRTQHPGRVLPSQQSQSRAEVSPACSTLEDVSGQAGGLEEVQISKGKKQLRPTLHLPQTAPAHHYPCLLLPAHEEFKWISKARSLPAGKQHCTLTSPDYRKKHRLVQKQNSSKKKWKTGEVCLGLGGGWHRAAYVRLQSNLRGLGELFSYQGQIWT